ncbi:hypothetical protein [Flavilitoribacter nigricans]|uniref:Chromosome segregation protein SMC n=1 Tax=Flavilitoribacter nigricans (strain ATCC 23147 / DSM 23189 / NBRC 102662 / NCIMB 1420 / SS-2) TaxID=1122177 RepID=A0A2D0ND47_FLAN2|nr:hypothetical protein [Flavilitoribacter nigricans]PHN06422.1 hypothetical protein CRP01_12700 [Flavilitoribacter nigricans DSM 23189 = NBRC 102662]
MYDESEQLKAELEKQYYEALSELEELRGSNDEMNALIEQQKVELKDQKDKITGLLKDSRNLGAARKELNALRAQAEGYIAEINQLREQNEVLTSENTQLSENNQQLNMSLEEQQMANAELSSERAVLVSEKEQLEEVRQQLSRKVNIASVIKVDGIEVTGLKTKKSGRDVKRSNADNIDKLQVCFNTTSNDVAEDGTEVFFVRIINPLGETLAIEEMGSGVMTNNANQEQVLYTQAKEMDYSGEAGNLCTLWTPNQPLQEGSYELEIYNKGYLAGTTSFRLK